MFAYVRYVVDGAREIINTNRIKKYSRSDPLDVKKKYKIFWQEKFYDGTIIMVADTKEEIEKKLCNKRSSVVPIDLLKSTDTESTDTESEVSDVVCNEQRSQQADRTNMQDILSRRLHNLENSNMEHACSELEDVTNENICPEIPAFDGEPSSKVIQQISDMPLGIQTETGQHGAFTKNINKENMISGIQTPSGKHNAPNKKPTKENILDMQTPPGKNIASNKKPNKENEGYMETKKENAKLKATVSEQNFMIRELSNLNIELQKKVISQMDELKETLGEWRGKSLSVESASLLPPIAYKRMSDDMMHLGHDVWLASHVYDSIVLMSRSSPQFVKNTAVAVFGLNVLKSSSVTGIKSNRTKNDGAPARPALDPVKLSAIKAIFIYWLKHVKKMDEPAADYEGSFVGVHISHKIADLNRCSKKSFAMPDVSCELLENEGPDLNTEF